MSIEAMKQMVEALEYAVDGTNVDVVNPAIAAGKKAIAEEEKQEPVAWVHSGSFNAMFESSNGYAFIYPSKRIGASKPLYTHPQPRREPLTDEQKSIVKWLRETAEKEDYFGHKYLASQFDSAANMIEAAHGIKEKNT